MTSSPDCLAYFQFAFLMVCIALLPQICRQSTEGQYFNPGRRYSNIDVSTSLKMFLLVICKYVYLILWYDCLLIQVWYC